MSTIWMNIGTVYMTRGAVGAARDMYARSLYLAEVSDTPSQRALVLVNLAELHLLVGDYEGAATAGRDAIALVETHAIGYRYPATLVILSAIYVAQGDLANAQHYADAARTRAHDQHDRVYEASACAVLGRLALARGDRSAAQTYLDAGLALSHEFPAETVMLLRTRGEVYLADGNLAAAHRDLAASLTGARQHEDRAGTAATLAVLAVTHARAGDRAAAQRCLAEAAGLAGDVAEAAPLKLAVLLAAAQVAQHAGRVTEAARLAAVVATHPRVPASTRQAAIQIVSVPYAARPPADLDALLAQLARA